MGIHSPRYRDGRRRRVLLEESRGEGRPSVQSGRNGRKRRYAPDALVHSQPAVTHFLPQRKRVILGLVKASLLLSAGVIGLDAWVKFQSPALPTEILQFCSAFQPGSLSSLLVCSQFAFAAGICVLIYAVRRRRLDDFHGTYQQWIVSAGVLAIFSCLAAMPAISLISWVLTLIPQIPRDSDPQKIAIASLGLIYSLLALRWAIEMRRCRIAQTCLALATLLALASQLDVVKIFSLSSYLLGQVISNILFFLAMHAGLLGLLLYGRYVRFDALGLLASNKKKLVKKKSTAVKRKIAVTDVDEEQEGEDEVEDVGDTEDEEDLEETEKIEAEPPVKKSDVLKVRQNINQRPERSEAEEIDFRELSRAERKKLRRDRRGE